MKNYDKFVVANWKMNLGIGESVDLTKALTKNIGKGSLWRNLVFGEKKVGVVIAPSAPAILEVSKLLHHTKVKIAAQDMSTQTMGPYTGEISPNILVEAGCDYVILGHSERKIYGGEKREKTRQKIKLAMKNDLCPIVCLGETYEDRNNGDWEEVIKKQLSELFSGIANLKNHLVILAYEPLWAIGSGKAASEKECLKALVVIKEWLLENYSKTTADNNFKILYGGSVNANNVAAFTRNKICDGVLVGNAGLKVAEFLKIVDNVRKN